MGGMDRLGMCRVETFIGTRSPSNQYRMYRYIVDELPGVIASNFPVDISRSSVFGHSMGGHGALVIAFR